MIKINDEEIILTLEEYKDNAQIDNYTFETEKEFYYINNLFFVRFTEDTNKNIKKLKKIKKISNNNLKLGVVYKERRLLGIIENCNIEIERCLKAIFIKEKNQQYEYIYDSICDELDKKWNEQNPCEFINDICVEERECTKNPRKNGCCYAFWYSKIPILVEGVHQCEYLNNEKHCTNKNASCKIFVCPYLKKRKKFKIDTRKILLIQLFLNKYQKLVLKENFFVDRKELIEKIKKEEKRIKPFIIYYSNRDFLVYKSTPKEKKELAKKYDIEYKAKNKFRQ